MYDFVKSAAVAAALLVPTGAMADWSGFYAGGSFGSVTSGEIGGTEIEDANPFGIFLGFQQQSGQFVFGGEYALALDAEIGYGTATDIAYAEADLKARIGYDLGQFMPYGVISLSSFSIADEDEDITGSGLGFGLGADFMVSDNFVVGGEILVRDTDNGEYSFDGFVEGTDIEMNATTMSLRASYKF